MKPNAVKIKVTYQGPYEVTGLDRVTEETILPDQEGASWEYRRGQAEESEDKPMALCRCGHSSHAPFCDGSHEHAEWDGEETASFEPIMDGAEAFPGPNLTLFDNENYCAYARFCDAKGRIWNLVGIGSEESDKLAIREAFHCPAGRLMMYKNNGEALEPELDPEISPLKDPAAECDGPLFVKGEIQVESEAGRAYELRNRQTLCRCGQSSNKPFCDGSHASVHFHARHG